MLWTVIQLAIRELWANKLRTTLTALGIIIGISSVIALVTLGNGVTAQVTSEFEGIGQNLIFVTPGGDVRRGGLGGEAKPFDQRDVDAIRRGVSNVDFIAPSAGEGVQAGFEGTTIDTIAVGSDDDYFDVRLWEFSLGRRFSEGELAAGRSVCVIGQTVREKLFGVQDPIGVKIRVADISCAVIGVLAPKGQTTFGNDEDDRILMPLRTFQRRILGRPDINTIQVAARSRDDIESVISQIQEILRERRKIPAGQPDDFTVEDVQAFVSEIQSVFGYMTMFVGAIAFVSLIVGGIGIMNIMLVSVTERTREIGIRLAIGAAERDVLMQFLIEAMILAVFGGIVGIVFGLGLSALATTGLGFPFLPSSTIIVAAVLFSAAFGIGFGFFPARRAARMNPIEALRFE